MRQERHNRILVTNEHPELRFELTKIHFTISVSGSDHITTMMLQTTF